MEEKRFVVKVGREYVTEISVSSGLRTSSRDKLMFTSRESAEMWSKVVTILSFGQETPRILSTEEDKKELCYVGATLKELIEKATPQNLERAKELFMSRYVTKLDKTYTETGCEYQALVKSQTSREYYRIVITLDKEKKVVDYTCSCPAHNMQNPLCKHILAVILSILEY